MRVNKQSSAYTESSKEVFNKVATTNTNTAKETDYANLTFNPPPKDASSSKSYTKGSALPSFDLVAVDNTRVVMNTKIAHIDIKNAKLDAKALKELMPTEEKLDPKTTMETAIKGFAEKYFENGKLSCSKIPEYEAEVNKLLQDPKKREALISYLKLNSEANKNYLMSAMCLEGGYETKSETFPVGAVMLNRAISTNITALAAQYDKTKTMDKFVPKTISNIIYEVNQFAISKSKFESVAKDYKANPKLDKYQTNKAVIDELLSGKNKFKLGEKEIDASSFFYFQKAKYPVTLLKTPAGHFFATHFDRKNSAYFAYNSFNRPKINWNN